MGAEYVICFGAQGRPSFDFNSRLTLILKVPLLLKTKSWQCFHFLCGVPFGIEFLSMLSCFRITGDLAHALRFLASVVSQSFIAFGDILELHKKFLELSGGINRIFELEELLQASQSSKCQFILKFSGGSSSRQWYGRLIVTEYL